MFILRDEDGRDFFFPFFLSPSWREIVELNASSTHLGITMRTYVCMHRCVRTRAHVCAHRRAAAASIHFARAASSPPPHPRLPCSSVRFVPGCRDQNPYHPFRRSTSTDFSSPLFSFFEVRPPIKLYLSPSSLYYTALCFYPFFLFFFLLFFPPSSVANRMRIHPERRREREDEHPKRTIPTSVRSI